MSTTLGRTKRSRVSEEYMEAAEAIGEKLEKLRQHLIADTAAASITTHGSIVFDTPVRTKLLITVSDIVFRKVIVYYNPSQIKIVGIRTDEFGTLSAVFRSDDDREITKQLRLSEILGLLFYSGAYEYIRSGKFSGSQELAESLLDIGELVYDGSLSGYEVDVFSNPDTLSYLIRWGNEPWYIIKYVGVIMESFGHYYKLFLTTASERFDEDHKLHDIPILDAAESLNLPICLRISKAATLPPIRRLINSIDELMDDIRRYTQMLKLAYVGVKTHLSLGGVE